MKFTVLLLAALLLTSCATPYQSKGFMGGFSETQLSENTFSIEFKGNANTDSERASDFALLRSAELTLEHGFKYFALVDSKNSTKIFTHQTPVRINTTGFTHTNGMVNMYGNNGYYHGNTFSDNTTTISGGQVYNSYKPSTNNLIMCFKNKPKGQIFLFEATAIKASLKKKYEIQ